MTLNPGDPAPSFSLRDDAGNQVTLDDYAGRHLVVFFYPKAFTSGCTTEACEFRDNIFAYRKLNAQILGVSLDAVESHKKFADNHNLPFPLLADTTGTTADAYGVKTRMFGWTVAKRQTFIINPDGVVVKHFEKVEPDVHSDEVLAELRALTSED